MSKTEVPDENNQELEELYQDAENDSFSVQLEETLRQTEQAVLTAGSQIINEDEQSWDRTTKIVRDFRPVPWFIWRLCNYVIGNPSKINPISDGLVFGLKKFVLTCGNDLTFNPTRERITAVRGVLQIIPSDVLVAFCFMYAISRRLQKYNAFERIWHPLLDDALLRAKIGLYVGRLRGDFGGGRGMLAGFSSRIGLVILIATGPLSEARRALEMLATGSGICEVGLAVYQVDPFQVSAMILTTAGCGRDAALGSFYFSTNAPPDNEIQAVWSAVYRAIEALRGGASEETAARNISLFTKCSKEELTAMFADVKTCVRRGHNWHWINQ